MGSITIAMIAVLLASIMLLVVKGFTSKETTQKDIQEIVKTSTPNQILAEYKRQSKTLKVCALGGGLLTLMFAMTFFSGDDLNPFTWVFGQWLAVIVGAVVVFGITATQYNLYQDVSGTKVALALTIGILVGLVELILFEYPPLFVILPPLGALLGDLSGAFLKS